MNPDESPDIIIEISDITKEKQLQVNLLPLPQFQKFHSSIAPPNKEFKIRGNSVPEDKATPENTISKSVEFKLIWILNHLSKMQLDLNRCYLILEKTNLEEDVQMEMILNNILNQYFSDEVFPEIIENNNEANHDKKSSKYKLIAKIFHRTKELQEKKTHTPEFKSKIMIPNKEEIKESEIIEVEIPNQEINVCTICYEPFPEDPLLLNKIPHHFCSSCLISYVQQKVFSNQILEIKCPDDCGHIYTDDQIHLILATRNDTFAKYLKFKNIAKISQDPNVRWCVKAECEGYMTGEKSSKKLTCPICQQDMCFLCRNAWHEGLSCEQAMNSEFKRYMERVEVKLCPKCKSKIEKSEGCNHMTCSRCHYQFCWICLGKYGSKHYDWYNPFGCSGMQYSKLRISWNCAYLLRLMKILMYLVLAVLIVGVAVAVSPLVILVMSIYMPFNLFYDKWRPEDSRAGKILYAIFFTLGVLILLPLEIALTIVPGSCLLGLYVLCYEDDD